jgi:hypothetical protein
VPGKEYVMNRSAWVRQIHRWVSMVFTVLVVIVTLAFVVQQQPAEWLVYSPLLPLGLLLLTGLYLFALPYLKRRPSTDRAARANTAR